MKILLDLLYWFQHSSYGTLKSYKLNLYQTNVIPWSERKDNVKSQPSPSRVLVLAKRRQISVGSPLREKSPDTAPLSSLRGPGAQDPTDPQAPQAAQMVGPGPTDCSSPRWAWREAHCSLKAPGQGQRAALVRAVEPCRTQPPACSLGPSAHLLARGQVSWRVPGRRPGAASYLTLCLVTTPSQTFCRMRD